MSWRVARGGKLWEQQKGEKNRRTFRRLVQAGRVYGVLAFANEEPIGWCSLGPRADFPRLLRSRVLQTEWGERTWSVVCFYIPTPWRHRGVATALLKEAVKVARDNGAKELEAYPVRPYGEARGEIPAAFAWTGVPKLFERQKFTNIAPPDHSRDIFLRKLRRNRNDRLNPRQSR